MQSLKNISFFFSINHIIKSYADKLIYGIKYNGTEHFLLKSLGSNDCEQWDNNASLNPDILHKICSVITEIEKEYKKIPPLEFINLDVFDILERQRTRRMTFNKNRGGLC